MSKNYDAIVEADWRRVEEDLKRIASEFHSSPLKKEGVHIPPALNTSALGLSRLTQSEITSDATYEGYSRFVVSIRFDTSPHISNCILPRRAATRQTS